MVERVGQVGAGSMGCAMAMNALRVGFDVMAYDIRPEPLTRLAAAGARVARSAREVGAHAEVTVVSVVDDAQAEAAICGPEGLLSGAPPGTAIAIQSTIHPATVRMIGARAREQGVQVIDAEVSNGATGAQVQGLAFMVGGDREALEMCRPVLLASGKEIFHMGALGAGAITKQVHQMMVVGTLMAVAEGLSLAEAAGVDPELAAEVINASAGRSYLAGRWLHHFKLLGPKDVDVLSKSVDPALAMARELDFSATLTAVAQQALRLHMTAPDDPDE
jgi:3-hydroxyisobutyrate dehydrogenase